jgi:hypothetical protein
LQPFGFRVHVPIFQVLQSESELGPSCSTVLLYGEVHQKSRDSTVVEIELASTSSAQTITRPLVERTQSYVAPSYLNNLTRAANSGSIVKVVFTEISPLFLATLLAKISRQGSYNPASCSDFSTNNEINASLRGYWLHSEP